MSKTFSNKTIFEIMRMSFIQLVLITVMVNISYAHSGYGQEILKEKVSLSIKSGSIKSLLQSIEKQVDVTFSYKKGIILSNEKINVEFKNETLEEVLNKVFSPKDISFRLIQNNQIVLNKSQSLGNVQNGENEPLINSQNEQVADITIKGKVTDSKGESLAGATILVKGTKQAVITDLDGSFTIEVPDARSVLVVSFTGFVSKEVAVTAGVTSIRIQLEEENKTLNEVIVVGYGSQKKASVTGAVVSVKGEALTKSASVNVSNSLAGRVSGVIANNRSGRPGEDGSTILIRGLNSFGQGTNPLIVVDGIPDRSLSRINSEDIETVTVLKDASAAIYGVRSANGVILITTKRGKSGKPTVKYDGSTGFQQLTRMSKRVNAWEYMTYFNELKVNNGGTAPYAQADIDKYKAGNDPNYTSTDWMKAVFRNSAPQTNHSLSVSGGNEEVKYYFSGQYLNQESNFKNSDENFKQFNLRSNIDVNVSKNLKINLDIAARKEDRWYPVSGVSDILHQTVSMYPFLPDYYSNGLPSAGVSAGKNPVLLVTSLPGYDKRINLVVNPKIGFDLKLPYITKGLSVNGYAAFDYNNYSQKKFKKQWDAYSYDRSTDTYINQRGNTGETSVYQREDLTNQNTYFLKLAYDRQFGKHAINAFAGYEQTSTNYKLTSAYRKNLLSDQLDQIFTGSTVGQDAFGFASQDGRESYLGRVAYSYDNKYLAEVSTRYNGSFNFAPSERWGLFPAVSLGWRISEESFFKDNIKIFDQFKLRGSWGLMGNDDMRTENELNQYRYLTRYQLITRKDDYTYFGNYIQAIALGLSSTPNPIITWEEQVSKNIGFDATLLSNKLNVTVDYFNYLRKGILATRLASVPEYTGLVLPPENIGKSLNRGFDLSVNYSERATALKYNIGFNFTYAKSKIIFLDESPNIPEWQKATGQAIDNWMVYQTNGIYRSQSDVDATPHLSGAKPGDLWIKDRDEDGSITSKDMVRIPESATPKIVYGIPMGLEYKGIALDLLWSGQAMAKQMILPQAQSSIVAPPTWLYEDRYTVDNPNAEYPRAFNSTDNRNNVSADFWLRDASFLRLKSAELSYVLPANMFTKYGVSNVRIYAGGSNLFSIDKMKKFNIDPETNNVTGITYPQTRIYRFGVTIGL
jgi:TonB-linked SusC/RagA family outer membrane protein